MPITTSAKKAIRVAARRRVFNLRRKEAMKEVIKTVRRLVSEKKADEAGGKISAAYKAIDKAAKGGVIKKNTAARYKSRLTKLLNKSSAAAT